MQIVATSQTSRFHVDTLTTLSTEIELKDVAISISNNDILSGSLLKLKAGIHYSLIGRNGVGKSTLLKSISERLIPGIPENLRILLVDQIESNTALLDSTKDLSITQKVVQSDRRREILLAEQQKLSKAFDASAVNDLAAAVASIQLDRSEVALEEAKSIALRRSGARGADARKALLKAEALVEDSKSRLHGITNGNDIPDVAEEASTLLVEIQNNLDAIDASATEANARSILRGLGFTEKQLDEKFSSLSGGWRSRCSLASALLQKPDILLLDEPTNFLDLQSIIWLQNYIMAFQSTVLAVAHDKAFVDAISDEIIILRDKKLTYFEGNLSQYQLNEKKIRKSKIKQINAMDKKRQAIEKSIEVGKKSAKKTGNENRLRMVKSRQKKLDERWGVEQSAKGTRFKLNRDFGGYATTMRAEMTLDEEDPPVTLIFPDPPALRFPGSLISASSISFKYPKRANNILTDCNITIYPGEKVALLGLNGYGKSTLVKLLIGGLKPIKGEVERHPRLRLGYYAQHSVEELSDPKVSSQSAVQYFLQKLKESGDNEVDESTARACLGTFGLQGKKALIPISLLSGGQKVRLALALVVYPAPDILVLDEVSTHLDMDTITALIHAIRNFTGAVVLVSHDRHLVKCAVEGAPLVSADGEDPSSDDDDEDEEDESAPGKVYMVGIKGNLKELPRGTDHYVEIIEKRMKREGLL